MHKYTTIDHVHYWVQDKNCICMVVLKRIVLVKAIIVNAVN